MPLEARDGNRPSRLKVWRKVCDGWCDQTPLTLHGAVWCCVRPIKCLTQEGCLERTWHLREEEEKKKRRPPFPQGMPLFICPPIGLPQQVSVKAQLHVGLRDSEAYKCMTGSSAPAGAGLSLGFKPLRLPLPQSGPFPRCQGPSVAPLNEGTAGESALKLCPFQILIRQTLKARSGRVQSVEAKTYISTHF